MPRQWTGGRGVRAKPFYSPLASGKSISELFSAWLRRKLAIETSELKTLREQCQGGALFKGVTRDAAGLHKLRGKGDILRDVLGISKGHYFLILYRAVSKERTEQGFFILC